MPLTGGRSGHDQQCGDHSEKGVDDLLGEQEALHIDVGQRQEPGEEHEERRHIPLIPEAGGGPGEQARRGQFDERIARGNRSLAIAAPAP